MLLRDLQKRMGVSYIVISHDLVTVAYLAATVAVMHRGQIVEMGPTQAIYRDAQHAYTKELLASTPSLDGGFLAEAPANG
jgi:peptide/nickel transport system ATP-binding protein